MKKNEWRISSKSLFAQWSIIFPEYETEEDAAKSFEVAQRILHLGQKYQVYRLLETSDGFLDNTDSKHSYVEFMRDNYEKNGYIPFFSHRIKPNRASSLIAYYQNDKVVESEVDNMVNLLKRLNSDDITHGMISSAVASFSPINLKGMELHLGKHYFRPALFIRLETNIWFPQIWGAVSNKNVDNSELANQHTPRLRDHLKINLEIA